MNMMAAINLEEIDFVILCGGLGKGLQEVIRHQPKRVARIDERPFLDLLTDYVASYGFRGFILYTGYMGDVIEEHRQKMRDGYPSSSRYKEVPRQAGWSLGSVARKRL